MHPIYPQGYRECAENSEFAVSADLVGMIAEAAEQMMRLSGGSAVCAMTKAGTSVPGIKYAEGRWAGLREVDRAIAGGSNVDVAVRAVAARWRKGLDTAIERESGRDWAVYRHGGVDAVADFADRLR